jgi:hypothetical protein
MINKCLEVENKLDIFPKKIEKVTFKRAKDYALRTAIYNISMEIHNLSGRGFRRNNLMY